MSEYTDARTEAATALLRKITEQVESQDNPKSTRMLAEAYALVQGSFTGGPQVNVKK
ncbi:MAG: hypothetical protein ACTH3G_04230 [Citricoccus sp.]